MAKTKKAELEKLMQKAGLDDDSKAKMHRANDNNMLPDDEKKAPKGHGSASPHHAVIDEI